MVPKLVVPYRKERKKTFVFSHDRYFSTWDTKSQHNLPENSRSNVKNMDQTNEVDQSGYSALLCRVQIATSSEEDQSWPQLNSQNQGKHNSQRNDHHCGMFRRHVPDMNPDTCFEDSLDLVEYPELGEKRVKTKNIRNNIVFDQEVVRPHIKRKEKNKKEKGGCFFPRAGKRFFDIKRALEQAERAALMNPKIRAVKLRADIYRVNTNPHNKNSSNGKAIEERKVKTYMKPKKLSSLKRKIILHYHPLSQLTSQEKRRYNIEENTMDVDSINFNTLKIKSDPELDIDYVKRMSTLTVYDTDYRDLKVENIPEDTVQYRPDLTNKLDDLQISNFLNRNISTTSYRNSLDNTNDLNILQNTLSLTNEDDVDHKPDIKPLFNKNELVKYSKNFREYCNNLITPSLNESLEKFFSEIKRLQTKFYDRDQNKGKYRRRYYTGLKEVQKHVALRKIRFVVIAPDIEKIQFEGGLDDEIDKLLEICRKNEIVFCFGLRRRKLGYYAHGNGFVSCIGIANYGNAEELFWNVLVEVAEARNKFEELQGRSEKTIDVSKIIPDNGLVSENIGILLKNLASIHREV